MLKKRCMLNKTITNNLLLVIFCTALYVCTAACHGNAVGEGNPPSFDRERSHYADAQVAGRLQSDEITESSGIAASKCQPDVLWTHNDSGDGPFLFAVDPKGMALGTWKIDGAENIDWEDIAAFKDAAGKCYLYVGDIGNSRKEPRGEHKIYRVAEPLVTDSDRKTSRKEPAFTVSDVLSFSYPDQRQDAETLLVHPDSGDIYVITKQRNTAAGVYRVKPGFGGPPVTAEKLGEIAVPAIPNGFLTGGDISPDGKRLMICDYFAAYEFTLPPGARVFDEIWKQKPVSIDLGERDQGEAIGYSADGSSLFATSEGKHPPLIRVHRKEQ